LVIVRRIILLWIHSLSLLIANRFCHIEFFMGVVGITSALVWVTFIFSLFMHDHLGSPFLHVLEHIQNSWKLQLLLLHHGCLFALGAYLWLLLFKGVTLSRLIIAAVCFAGGYAETLWAGKQAILDGRADLPIMVPPAIWTAFILLIIGSIAMNDRACAWAGVRARAIRMLGLMTYPLYLLHQTVGSAVVLTLHDHGIPRFPALFFAIAICLAVSWIIASALEPGLKRHLQLTFARIEASLRRGAPIASLFQPTKPPLSDSFNIRFPRRFARR
jgi:peptidoglycan/LPS O-acetylase OafA/YrhL